MMERSRSSPNIIGILQRDTREVALRLGKIANRDQSIPDWIPVNTFYGAWVYYGGIGAFVEDTVGYWRSSSGIVLLKGVVKNGIIPSDLFTLEPGFRPAFRKRFPIISNGVFGYVSISETGNVKVEAGSNVKVELSGISFRAEL